MTKKELERKVKELSDKVNILEREVLRITPASVQIYTPKEYRDGSGAFS